MSGRDVYPLAWPPNWPRSKSRGSSQFKTSLPKSLSNVQDSVRRFSDDSGKKVTDLLISSNVSLGNQSPKDPGVAVYFTWDEIETCIAVDRYAKVQDNLQAIHHCIEAERTKLRHGGLNLVRAAFTGYAKLPAPSRACEAWAEILGVKKNDDPDKIQHAYQKLRSKYHPDRETGDTKKFKEVQDAWDHYLKFGKD